MVYPYDTPEQWQAGFPAGWNPQAVLMQALQMQPGGPPVMPQATRGSAHGAVPSNAACNWAMSSFFMPISACMAPGSKPSSALR